MEKKVKDKGETIIREEGTMQVKDGKEVKQENGNSRRSSFVSRFYYFDTFKGKVADLFLSLLSVAIIIIEGFGI